MIEQQRVWFIIKEAKVNMDLRYCEKIQCPYNDKHSCTFKEQTSKSANPKEEWPRLRETFIQHGCRVEELVRAAAPAIILRE